MTELTCESAAACQAINAEMLQLTVDLLFATMVIVMLFWIVWFIFIDWSAHG